MKFSAQEEYGLRCLVRIAQGYKSNIGKTIPEISEAEGISQHNVAKLLRNLRLGGFLESERGQSGGYSLSRKPSEIKISDVLDSMGGRLFDESFCQTHSGVTDICAHSVECSTRSLWRIIQEAVDSAIGNITLEDLLVSEEFLLQKANGQEYLSVKEFIQSSND